MAYPTRLLHPGEEVLHEQHFHAGRLTKPALLAVLVLGGSIAGYLSWHHHPRWFEIALAALVGVAIVQLVVCVLAWRSELLVITSLRIIVRQGMFRRVGREVGIEAVRRVEFHQRLIERILRRGTLLIELGADDRVLELHEVARPVELQQAISVAMTSRLPARTMPSTEIRPYDVESDDEPVDQLEALEELHRLGVITSRELAERSRPRRESHG